MTTIEWNLLLLVVWAMYKRARWDFYQMEDRIRLIPVHEYHKQPIRVLHVTDEGVVEDLNPINLNDPWSDMSYFKGDRPPWFQVLNE